MLASQLARARLATARYATNLHAAKADGYQILTRMIPDMGYHFLNPTIQGFDVTKPPILVYERHGKTWQLGALEWVFPTKPATPPLPGATYGSFGAACHYKDGTFVFASSQDKCPKRSPRPAPPSTSGTRTWSLCTCGSGTPTRPGSTAAPTPTSSPSTAARPHRPPGRGPELVRARVPGLDDWRPKQAHRRGPRAARRAWRCQPQGPGQTRSAGGVGL